MMQVSIVDGNHFKERYNNRGEMATTAHLTGKETNRSVRKTMITALARNDVPEIQIIQLTGHKNLHSFKFI